MDKTSCYFYIRILVGYHLVQCQFISFCLKLMFIYSFQIKGLHFAKTVKERNTNLYCVILFNVKRLRPQRYFQGRFLFGESTTAIFKINCKKEKLIFGWYYFDGGFWYTPQNSYKPSLDLRVETQENHIDSNILLLLYKDKISSFILKVDDIFYIFVHFQKFLKLNGQISNCD